jgi:hypothetical protein
MNGGLEISGHLITNGNRLVASINIFNKHSDDILVRHQAETIHLIENSIPYLVREPACSSHRSTGQHDAAQMPSCPSKP